MTDTPPMSAEDRALTALAYAIYRHKYPTGGGYGDDPAAWPIGGSVHEAKQLLEALSSEGLVVVAREDVERAVEALEKAHEWLERVDQRATGYFGLDHKLGENDDGCTFCFMVRRLSGAEG